MYKPILAWMESKAITASSWTYFVTVREDSIITGDCDVFQVMGISSEGCCEVQCASPAVCGSARRGASVCTRKGKSQKAFTMVCETLVCMTPTNPQVIVARVCSVCV